MPTEIELRDAITELADEASQFEFGSTGRARRPRLLPALAAALVVVLAVTLVVATRRGGHDEGAAPSPTRTATAARGPVSGCGPMTTPTVCSRLLTYARRSANNAVSQPATNPQDWPRAVTAVAVLRHRGTELQPNVGPACSSGLLLTIYVLGVFDRAVISHPSVSRGGKTRDFTVVSLIMDADASTGQVCLSGAGTRAGGPSRVPDGAVVVYRRR